MMNFTTALIALGLVFVTPCAWGLCMDKTDDQMLTKAIKSSAKSILNPGNKKAVPPGLPDVAFPVRTVRLVATVQGISLVFISFKETDRHDDDFIAPYSFAVKTGKLKKLLISDLGNNDARFWRAKESILLKCNAPTVSVTYDACSACGAGANLVGKFFFTDGEWLFKQDPANASKLEGD